MSILEKSSIVGLSVDELLELSVDQLAEVQPFVPKPTGMYAFTVTSCGVEEVGDANAIVVEYQINECIELEDEEKRDTVGEMPAKYTEKYFIGGKSEFGLITYRTIFGGLVGEGEEVKIRDLMEMCVGATGEAILKHRKWKHKETKEDQEGNQWDALSVVLH